MYLKYFIIVSRNKPLSNMRSWFRFWLRSWAEYDVKPGIFAAMSTSNSSLISLSYTSTVTGRRSSPVMHINVSDVDRNTAEVAGRSSSSNAALFRCFCRARWSSKFRSAGDNAFHRSTIPTSHSARSTLRIFGRFASCFVLHVRNQSLDVVLVSLSQTCSESDRPLKAAVGS